MTTLTRIRLAGTDRSLARELADPVALHRRIMTSWGHVDAGDARAALGVLWRLETDEAVPVLLVQSHQLGDWAHLPAAWTPTVVTKVIDAALDSINSGRTLRFRLRANATRKIDTKTGPDGERHNGRRVPLRDPEQAVAWLGRHAETSGFNLVQGTTGPSVTVRPSAPVTGRRSLRNVTIEAVTFDGLLTVDDPRLLYEAIRSGIGPAKAYGCGLLSVARNPT